VLNEIQMLLYTHPVNDEREARGELPVNSVWLWGGGRAQQLGRPYARAGGDSELAAAFAKTAGLSYAESVARCSEDGEALIVCEGLRHALRRGDLHAWRMGVQRIERDYAAPLLQALRAGKVAQVTLDVLREGASRRLLLGRSEVWKLWRRPVLLAHYSA
jgi:hypothetical protein